jgi:hypothetical protein
VKWLVSLGVVLAGGVGCGPATPMPAPTPAPAPDQPKTPRTIECTGVDWHTLLPTTKPIAGPARLVLATELTPWGVFGIPVTARSPDEIAADLELLSRYMVGDPLLYQVFFPSDPVPASRDRPNAFGLTRMIVLVNTTIDLTDPSVPVLRDVHRIDGTAAFSRTLEDVMTDAHDRYLRFVKARDPAVRKAVDAAFSTATSGGIKTRDREHRTEEGFTAAWSARTDELVVLWMREEHDGADIVARRAAASTLFGLEPPQGPHVSLRTVSGLELRYDHRGTLVAEIQLVPFTSGGYQAGDRWEASAREGRIVRPPPRSCAVDPRWF